MQKPVTAAGAPVSADIRPVTPTRPPCCRVMNPCRISFSQAYRAWLQKADKSPSCSPSRSMGRPLGA